jgi:hypothetical protein
MAVCISLSCYSRARGRIIGMTHKSFITNILTLAVFLCTAAVASADATIYHMTAGDRVSLKWDSQNVVDCRASNNYHSSAWGSANYSAPWSSWAGAPANFGSYNYATGTLSTPGSYVFRFNCQNDDDTTRYAEDEYITIYPVPVSAPTLTSSCSGTTCTLNWTSVPNATSYVIRVTKPAGQSCPSGWSTYSSTVCERTVTGSNTTYVGVSGTTYPWAVASRTGTLRSSITNSGVYVGDNFVSAQASENLDPTTPASVNLQFRVN